MFIKILKKCSIFTFLSVLALLLVVSAYAMRSSRKYCGIELLYRNKDFFPSKVDLSECGCPPLSR